MNNDTEVEKRQSIFPPGQCKTVMRNTKSITWKASNSGLRDAEVMLWVLGSQGGL